MRRAFFLAAALPTVSLGWLLWTSACENDNYRDELPLRSYDAAPKDLASAPPQDAATPDLKTPDDMSTPSDMSPMSDMMPRDM